MTSRGLLKTCRSSLYIGYVAEVYKGVRRCIVSQFAGRPCGDDGRHYDRVRSIGSHGAREDGDHAAAHITPGTLDVTARRRSSRTERIVKQCSFSALGGLDASADIIMPEMKRWGYDSRGHATNCTIRRQPRSI